MVLVIALTGGKPAKTARAADAAVPTPLDPSSSRIQEYRARIDAEAKKLAAEQAELDRTKATLTPGGATGNGRRLPHPLRASARTGKAVGGN